MKAVMVTDSRTCREIVVSERTFTARVNPQIAISAIMV